VASYLAEILWMRTIAIPTPEVAPQSSELFPHQRQYHHKVSSELPESTYLTSLIIVNYSKCCTCFGGFSAKAVLIAQSKDMASEMIIQKK